MESEDSRCLSRAAGEDAYVGVLKPMVIATWTNDKVIITKQHPSDEWHRANYFVTEYYVVVVGDDKYGLNDSIIGPLSEDELKVEQKRLGLPMKIKFNEIDW